MKCHYTWSWLIALVLLIAGCNSMILTNSWKDPTYNGKIKRVFLIGIAKKETIRRIFEDEFSKQLAIYAVTGISSYNDLPTSEEINKERIDAIVKENGADSVLIVRTIGVRTEAFANLGKISTYDYYPDPMNRNYGSYYERSRVINLRPATVNTFDILTIEANLYNANSTELIWSGQLETADEDKLEEMITNLIQTITKSMKSDGLI